MFSKLGSYAFAQLKIAGKSGDIGSKLIKTFTPYPTQTIYHHLYSNTSTTAFFSSQASPALFEFYQDTRWRRCVLSSNLPLITDHSILQKALLRCSYDGALQCIDEISAEQLGKTSVTQVTQLIELLPALNNPNHHKMTNLIVQKFYPCLLEELKKQPETFSSLLNLLSKIEIEKALELVKKIDQKLIKSILHNVEKLTQLQQDKPVELARYITSVLPLNDYINTLNDLIAVMKHFLILCPNHSTINESSTRCKNNKADNPTFKEYMDNVVNFIQYRLFKTFDADHLDQLKELYKVITEFSKKGRGFRGNTLSTLENVLLSKINLKKIMNDPDVHSLERISDLYGIYSSGEYHAALHATLKDDYLKQRVNNVSDLCKLVSLDRSIDGLDLNERIIKNKLVAETIKKPTDLYDFLHFIQSTPLRLIYPHLYLQELLKDSSEWLREFIPNFEVLKECKLHAIKINLRETIFSMLGYEWFNKICKDASSEQLEWMGTVCPEGLWRDFCDANGISPPKP